MRISRFIIAGTMCIMLAGVPAQSVSAQEQVETSTKSAMSAPTFTNVTDEMLLKSRSDAGKNWLMYGRDYNNQRWSPLSQVNTATVRGLRVSWIYQTGISRLGSFEVSPVVVDGVDVRDDALRRRDGGRRTHR